jgi:transcriptional regulator with XRE-family HTH domain
MGSASHHFLRQALAVNVRNLRLGKRWTQNVLARHAGISATYLSQIESAKRAVSVDVLEQLATSLDVDAALLIVHSENQLQRSLATVFRLREPLALVAAAGSNGDDLRIQTQREPSAGAATRPPE